VPYWVVCLKAPEGDGTGTGGGCQSYSACALVDYGYRCAYGAVTHIEYDDKGWIIKATDPEGRRVQIAYDDYGRVASVLNALGFDHSFEYDYDESRQKLSPFSPGGCWGTMGGAGGRW
jgi:YD repeat-containing protein